MTRYIAITDIHGELGKLENLLSKIELYPSDIFVFMGDYIGIQVAQELSLEKTYNADLSIDYSKADNTNNYDLIKRFQHLLHTSQIRNNLGGMSFADVDTIHFSNKYKNSIELIQQARHTLVPTPVNYNNAKISGWVD